jgi:N-methylhydantoinase A
LGKERVEMSVIIGIDIGGTFTDVVGFDTNGGRLHVTKVSSTPENHALGFKRGLDKIIRMSDCKVEEITGLSHGTTVGTNAILERKGAKIGILTTKGFEDVLVIGRQKRSDMYDLFIDPETPLFLAPRRRTIGVTERVDSKGRILVKLAREEVERASDSLINDHGVESIAVSYLFSFLNPEHEKQTRAILSERHPEIRASLSSTIDPRFREYERLCLAAFDAYIGPVIENYLKNIQEEIGDYAIEAELHVMQSRGGITGADTVLEKAVSTILSGPAAGVVGCNFVGQTTGEKNLMTMDMGGTSCDAALIQEGKPLLTMEGKVDKYPLRLPMLDVNTIGAGGGGIAWIDMAGGLRVGPISAGANPGPACYGLGGDQPTVTDASLVLGYLNPRYFAGGEFDLQPQLAEQSMKEKIANPLKVGVLEAARGIHRIINSKMADQLRLISVGKGQDPRKFALMAIGGAGPVHAGKVAEQLSIKRVIVPMSPGVLSAFGLLVADIEHDHAKTVAIKADQANPVTLNETFKELDAICSQKMEKDKIPLSKVRTAYYAEMRYVGQAYEIEVPMPHGRVTQQSIGEVVMRFHQGHEAIYGHHDVESPVEFVSFRAVQTYSPPKPSLPRLTIKGTLADAQKGKREAYFEGRNRPIQTPIYNRWKLPLGGKIKGPAIIEQEDTTTVIYPGHEAHLDDFGNVVIDIP